MNRRSFLEKLLKFFCTVSAMGTMLEGQLRLALAQAKRRIVERGTPMSKLMHAHPERLDTSALETTPMDEFDVMGETTLAVDVSSWRLQIDGEVGKPASLDYQSLIKRPKLERNGLLVCPGFFAYNGFWTGFSVADLLREHKMHLQASHVLFWGSEGFRKKKKRYALDEVLNDRVFIAYAVNGVTLPQRHGYPMRLVALDHRGGRWVKYVNRITVERR